MQPLPRRTRWAMEFLTLIPSPALAAILYVLSWIPFIPLMKANYQGIRMLGGQIAFTFALHLPAFIYCVLGMWMEPVKLLVPLSIASALDTFIVYDYFGWKGSTAALGLFVLIPGEALILGAGFAVVHFLV